MNVPANAAAALHELGTLDLREGRYEEARASSQYQLATLDLFEGKDADALARLVDVLAVRQEAGAKAGEAAVWQNLGALALKQGRIVEGLRLLCLCYLLEQAVGVTVGALGLDILEHVVERPDYVGPLLQAILEEVIAAYEDANGAALLAGAFPRPIGPA